MQYGERDGVRGRALGEPEGAFRGSLGGMKRTSRRPRRNPSPLDSPAFRRWFGDSKVVDENGQPLVVYHGTDKRFTVFRSGGPDGGIWFSRDKGKIQRGESGAVGTKHLVPVYLRMQKPAGWDEYDRYYTDQLLAMSYDGLILDDDYVVFDPRQIKSATDNVGTFDPENPSILKNRRTSRRPKRTSRRRR